METKYNDDEAVIDKFIQDMALLGWQLTDMDNDFEQGLKKVYTEENGDSWEVFINVNGELILHPLSGNSHLWFIPTSKELRLWADFRDFIESFTQKIIKNHKDSVICEVYTIDN